MSTRSGKRIHNSFHEDTASEVQEAAVKSERKTRSKLVKENLEEVSVSLFKNKKRKNYVSYPTDDDLLGDTATRKDDEAKSNRVLRKNALKEQNPVETEMSELQTEAISIVRKSRRGKKCPEDVEDTENHENVPTDYTKQSKSKKIKKNKTVNTQIENPPPFEEAPAKKSKKKKKKGKKASSIVTEEVQQNDVSKNGRFNRSNMSVDSFHSAAGSPNYKNDDVNKKNDKKLETTFENEELNESSVKSNKKRSTNNTFNKNNVSLSKQVAEIDANNDTLNGSKRRKSISKNTTFDKSNTSVTKDLIDNEVGIVHNISNMSNGPVSKRNSNTKEAIFDITKISITNVVDDSESILNVSNKQTKRRKSIKETQAAPPSENMSQTINVDKNNTFDKVLKKKSAVKDDTFDKNNLKEIIDAETDNISNKPMRTRRSTLQNTFDKSDTSDIKEILQNGDVDVNISSKQAATRKSIKDSTFDKSNASIINENNLEKDAKLDLNESSISYKQLRRGRSSIKDVTNDKIETVNTTYEKSSDSILKEKANKKDSTFDKSNNKSLNATFDKNIASSPTDTARGREDKSSVNTTFDKNDKNNDTFEKYTSTSFDVFKQGALTRKSSIRDTTFDKSNTSFVSLPNEDFENDKKVVSSSAKKRKSIRESCDKNGTISENGNISYDNFESTNKQRKSPRFSQPSDIQNVLNTTFEKEDLENEQRKSSKLSHPYDIQNILNTTFEKEDVDNEKDSLTSESKSSLISSDGSSATDKSDISRISITSDDTAENIVNTTPVLIESSMDESHNAKHESPKPQTPLKREGTFTKDCPDLEPEMQTPTKCKLLTVPAAGCTPYHVSKSSQKKSMLNVTRSLEKGSRPSLQPAPRLTKVMFCSPVDNPVAVAQEKRKVIKSNLKGSNKSFVFEETASLSRTTRKRSYTQSDADSLRAKRSRLTDDLQQSVNRLSRPRTTSATGKLSVVTPAKKATTPSKAKAEGVKSRTRLPNFAALHQKEFDKMESLGECQQRRAQRARQLLTPTAPPGLLDRISPKNEDLPKVKDVQEKKIKDKTDTPTKKLSTTLPTLESLRPGFTRFGFKLNLDVNPFSIPSKTEKPKEKVAEKATTAPPRPVILPSLAGATSLRREAAKKAVMREKSFSDKRNENRTIIKGVRTNRRFELQMKMRNLD